MHSGIVSQNSLLSLTLSSWCVEKLSIAVQSLPLYNASSICWNFSTVAWPFFVLYFYAFALSFSLSLSLFIFLLLFLTYPIHIILNTFESVDMNSVFRKFLSKFLETILFPYVSKCYGFQICNNIFIIHWASFWVCPLSLQTFGCIITMVGPLFFEANMQLYQVC